MPKVAIALVDGVGNVALHAITEKAAPVVVELGPHAFVRTGETVKDLLVYRIRVTGRPGIRPTVREHTLNRYTAWAA
jgi:hypothetical protein